MWDKCGTSEVSQLSHLSHSPYGRVSGTVGQKHPGPPVPLVDQVGTRFFMCRPFISITAATVPPDARSASTASSVTRMAGKCHGLPAPRNCGRRSGRSKLMAHKPVSYCVEAGCRAKAVRGGRCGAHAREAWGGASRREGTTTERGYGARHRRRRASELAAEPWCYVCGMRPAVAIDHVVPLAQGGDDTDENRMPICRSCHSAKTQWETRHAWEFAGSSGRHKIDKVRQTIKKRGGF